jgi:hypothetical protein
LAGTGGGGVGGTHTGGDATTTEPENLSLLVITDCNPVAMRADPKRMKQPASTVLPRRYGTRPDSRSIPRQPTAITAIVLATVPRSVACSHVIAATSALDPLGLERDVDI